MPAWALRVAAVLGQFEPDACLRRERDQHVDGIGRQRQRALAAAGRQDPAHVPGRAERARFAVLLGAVIAAPAPLPDEPRGWRRMNLLFLARSTWLPTVYALIRLPMSARPIQTEAINQMFSNIDFFFQQIGRARPPGASAQTVSALSVPPDLTQLYLSIKTPSDWKESLAHAIFPCGKANSIALVDPTGLFASDQSKIERDHTGAGLSISSPHGMLPVHCFRLIAKTSVGNPRKTVCFSSFIPFFSATRRDGTLSG